MSPTPSPITIIPNHRIAWGGLDFDTGELDTEILRVLSVIAPPAGSLRTLKVTATIREALTALDDDCGADGETRTTGTVAGQMAVCLDRLDKVRVHLWEAHEALRAAEAMLTRPAVS